MADPKKNIRMISPAGVAQYPWLNKPDTKFKPEGEYRVKLRLSQEDGEALVAKLQPIYDAHIAALTKAFAENPKNKGKKIKLSEQEFFTMVVDDNGDETGEYEFNFKRLASGVSKKTGNPWAIKPDLFNSKGKPLDPSAKIFGGTVMKVAFEVVPYDTPKAHGIKLSMTAVQVIKLVEGNRDAASYGFGDEGGDDDEGGGTSFDDESGSTDGAGAPEGGAGDDF